MGRRKGRNEFVLIGQLRASVRARADVGVGIGDDGAIVRPRLRDDLVLAIDTLVAGVHFPARTDAAAVGWKALAVNLSDLAAMGAEPAWATLALTLPRGDARWVRDFARGFGALAKRYDVALVGGDTTRGPLTVTVQAHGFVPRGRALLRSGAKVGDRVYVSGTPGDAAAGLAIVQRRLRATVRDARALVARLERPGPRVALGVALRGVASAAIDVSDGLAQDLGHVLAASGVGAELDVDAVPASAALRRAAPERRARRALQLAGGDDYELCFTVPARRAARVAAIAAKLRLKLTAIGTIVVGRGLRLHDAAGHEVASPTGGWDHFRS
jgi:thiamine-monophosphate kinase